MTARDKILSKIRKALKKPVEMPYKELEKEDYTNIFHKHTEDPTVLFAENFKHQQGQFIYCANEKDFVEKLSTLLENCNWKRIACKEPALINLLQHHDFHGISFDSSETPAAITSCEKLIARTGSILLSSNSASGRALSIYTPVHICIAYTDQIVYDITDGLHFMKEKYETLPSLITLATGPSRTADIEKTLVVGIHGPKQVFVFLIEK